MEQNFDSRQFATSEKDVSGDDSESSSVVVQETSASTISTTTSATSPATRGTFSFSLLFSLRFLIGAKSQIEMGFTY